ncbi:MAG: hypothetical protein IJS96_06260 [Schwartzia sp.]|nr:hypothetical protein [Schwartzia sp. (in: firmicutes)]
MRLFSRSIRTLFIVSVIVISSVLLGALTFINVRQLSDNMEAELESMLKARSGEISEKFDKRLTQVSGKTMALALNISSMQTYDMDLAGRYITALVQSDEAIFGSGLWFAPNAYPGRKWFGPYYSKESSGNVTMTMDYSTEEYNYPQFGWYKASIQGGQDGLLGRAGLRRCQQDVDAYELGADNAGRQAGRRCDGGYRHEGAGGLHPEHQDR